MARDSESRTKSQGEGETETLTEVAVATAALAVDVAAEPGEHRARKTIRYAGTEAVTVIVPRSRGGYEGLITEGDTFTFRPGQALSVPERAATWLKRHPVLKFEE